MDWRRDGIRRVMSTLLPPFNPSIFLKNRLELPAHQVADFKLIAAIPSLFAFVVGLIRYICSPFGWRYRCFMLLLRSLGALTYLLLTFCR
jgi:hypothetical protein